MQEDKTAHPDQPETGAHNAGQKVVAEVLPFDITVAHADNIEDMVKDYCAKVGGKGQAAKAFAAAQVHGAQPGSHARAKQLAMAYAIEHHAHQSGQLRRLFQLKGDMRKCFNDDITKIGK